MIIFNKTFTFFQSLKHTYIMAQLEGICVGLTGSNPSPAAGSNFIFNSVLATLPNTIDVVYDDTTGIFTLAQGVMYKLESQLGKVTSSAGIAGKN
jgi:hypothetical protein